MSDNHGVAVKNLAGSNFESSIQGNVAAGAADSGNPVKTGGKHNTTLPTLSNGHRGDTQLTARGATLASLITVAGAELDLAEDTTQVDGGTGFTQESSRVQPMAGLFDDTIGVALTENDVAASRINLNRATVGVIEDGTTRARYAGVTASGGVKTTTIVDTAGGATPYKLISAASTNATSVKGSGATLYGIQVFNVNAEERYLKLYNKATAPTVGTDTPVKVILIPGATTGSGTTVPLPAAGVAFGTGLAFALTTGIADSDTGAVAANEIVVNLDYA